MPLAVTALEVALAGVIVTGVVGAVGPIVSALVSRADRRQHREVARDERLFTNRVAAYEDLVRHARRQVLAVDAVYRWSKEPEREDPPIELPEVLSSGQWLDIAARAAIYGSDRLLDCHNTLGQAVQDFMKAAPSREVFLDGGEQAAEALAKMAEMRERVGEALGAVQAAARSDVTKA